MKQTHLTNLILDQSKDLVWVINLDFQLIYANKAYLNLLRKITGMEKKLNESVLVEGFGAGDIEQWKTYYNRALKGESFELEEHYNHPESNEIQYSQVTFEPLTGDDDKIFAIACQSRDGTALVKQRSEANQLIIANKELVYQTEEKKNRADELIIANKELVFQNEEKKNRADELVIANKELDFQNEEKKNRADELVIANKELDFQNEEKKNRADELIIANKELDFQNEEKKNRADELIIANKELAFQTGEKKNRAEELTIAHKETDSEKNRANQLAIAIKALSDYKYALDQSSIIAITDQKGIINYVNEKFCKISKYSADELIGQDHKIISSGYHSKEFIKDLWTTISHGKIWRGELKNSAKDGTVYWGDTTIVPFLNEKGKPTQYLSIRTDITKKKEEEHRLKLLESVITNTKDAVLITEAEPFDHPGPRILYVNEAFTKMTGYTSDEVIGKTPRILQGPNSDKEELSRLGRAIRNWESCEITTINYKKNGEEFWINFTLTPVADQKGGYTHWIATERDVTEQKQMTLQLNELNQSLQKYSLELERSNEELEQFAFVASHDLQEPLRMISSFMDLLSRKYGNLLDEKAHQYIHFATDGAKRMKQIILDLLDYSRASKIPSTKEEVDFNLVLSEFMQLRRKLISEKSASITSGNLPSLISYKASITQVFHCLLDNALQYSGVGIGPIIEINVLENKEEWEFSIKDNGIGIDPQFHDKIFVIFQRLHNKEEYTGTGIGLSIAKKQVEFLGGKIWLESEPGLGTVFYFTIPKNN